MNNKTRSIQVLSADEPWCFIALADGTVIKTRHIVTAVLQVLDDNGNPVIDDSGCARYAIGENLIVVIDQSPMIEERQLPTLIPVNPKKVEMN